MTVSLRAPAPFARAALALAVSLTLAGCAGTASRAPVTINLVAMNDFHGNLEPSRYVPTNPDGSKAAAIRAGGAEAVAAALQAWRKQDKDLLFVSAGDLVGASPAMSSLWADEPTIEAMNMLDLRVSAVGNHEFDAGRKELLRQQNGGCDSPRPAKACQMAPNFGGAKFTYLAGNVVDKATGKPFIPAFRIVETKGIKVGLVGVVLQDTRSVVMASGIAGLEFGDEAAAINRAIPDMRRQGADVIVALVHQGGSTPEHPLTPGCSQLKGPIVDVVKQLDPAIRLVITGHTHQGYLCKVDGRTVTQASSYGHLLTRIAMKVEKGVGQVGEVQVENVLMKAGDYPADEKMAAFMAKVKDSSRAALTRPVARLASAPVLRKQNAAGEAPLGNLIADAVLAATRNVGARIGFMNEGGIRKDLEAGEGKVAAFGQVQAVLPFGNTLVVMDLSGAQIRALLERQWNKDGSMGSMLQISNGFSYTWDEKRPVGSRVTAITLDGKPLEDSQRYRIVANNFLAEGGDNYPEFGQGSNRLETGLLDLDAFAEYLRATEGQGAAMAPAAPRIIKAQ
ncbi:multifunctional 2',3'-cyclic-nucleotide 2'-phosphodiesterase/5'-nucleotidase/3'-nucleotidase [Massilia varians]|uniref:Multifunctional 2',3'-cyclic-nucleotide 2'-phosphodiesterase/5'-nucleotidase/3'-nucleotidase n=1 Tax=Massilia varians TaxID=457921 RepID=A0ABN6T6D0_9BURK|nr:bifunctional metallophosphatase/5'-nucleotidase [Massilia varians]BDT57804.1 multifunctional 2',3'-cyclic-nucleotide 2'-phosphodiesterase/5'-nucleotidase/3'-nucleotidase [Massilia varians]